MARPGDQEWGSCSLAILPDPASNWPEPASWKPPAMTSYQHQLFLGIALQALFWPGGGGRDWECPALSPTASRLAIGDLWLPAILLGTHCTVPAVRLPAHLEPASHWLMGPLSQGTFFPWESSNETLPNRGPELHVQETERMVYLAVAEHFFDSALWAYYQAGVLSMEFAGGQVQWAARAWRRVGAVGPPLGKC